MAIVARLTNGHFVIGLEAENIKRIKEDKPFFKRLADYGGPDVTIYLVYGETRDDIVRKLSGGITEDTRVIDETKAGKA